MSRRNLSESMMADVFESCLREPGCFSGLPRFDCVFREVICQQGIADFVTFVGPRQINHPIGKVMNSAESNGTGSIRILSLLRPKVPRTEKHIVRSTGYSNQMTRRILSTLVERKVVKQNKRGSYVLCERAKVPQIEFWAFELKLRDWKRALFQALQCKAFASYVMTVFPKELASLLNKHLEKFRKMKVGVMLFDPVDKSYEILVKPLKSRPSSRMHYIYAFSKITGL